MASRTVKRAMSIAVVLAVTIGMVAVLVPVAGAASPPCRVTNLMTQQIYDGTGSNLQAAIDQAASGTRLRVRGVCIGNFDIAKDLKLMGRSTAAFPKPTLDGNRSGRVLTVSEGSVELKDLKITHGIATAETEGDNLGGGGIFNGGILILRGSTRVSHNRASTGGGIFSRGSLTMMGSSSVIGNRANLGGGIVNMGGVFAGTLTLNGRSSVAHNLAVGQSTSSAGGIYNANGTIVMNDASEARGNSARSGGGIYNNGGTLTLNGSSSVEENTAGASGGVVNGNGATLTMNGSSSIRANTAEFNGGGILNSEATVAMNDDSSVRLNAVLNGVGGGIYNSEGILVGVVAGGNVSDNVPDDIFTIG